MTDVRERLRSRIEEVIDRSDMSRREVAEYLGVSPMAVYNWINGKNAPDLDMLVKICELFNVSFNVMYGVEPLPNGEPDIERQQLLECFNQLNLTGRIKLADFADDLVSSGKYKPYKPKKTL